MSTMRNPNAMFHQKALQMPQDTRHQGRGRRRANKDMALVSRFMDVANLLASGKWLSSPGPVSASGCVTGNFKPPPIK